MNNISGLLKALLVGLVIPLIGFAVSNLILGDMNADLAAENFPDAIPLCQSVATGELGADISRELSGYCERTDHIAMLGQGSVIAGAIGAFIPLLFWLTSLIAGENRKRISVLFPLILRLSILLIAISVVLQGAILTYAVYIGEVYAIGRVHLFIIAAVGLGALAGGLKLIGASFSFGKKLTMTAWGKPLTEKESPHLFGFVQSLAKKLGAKPPNNIVIGLDPTFYVTSNDVHIPGNDSPLKGETLFISAPLSRVLSREEFASVIGHELGHFRGEDTAYSMRFSPIYAGLGEAINGLSDSEEGGAMVLAKLPAMVLLSYMYELFATNQAKISRDREHKADIAGAEAGSALALCTALIKVSLYSGLWNHARGQNVERLKQGKITRNLSAVFQDSAKYDVEHEKLSDILEMTLSKSIPHPTDTHPPVSKRLIELGISSYDISKQMLLIHDNSAIDIIDNFEAIEEEVTINEHRLMVALGAAELPEEEQRNHLLHATYSLAAAMVRADGNIDPQEILTAEAIGKHLFEDFDPVEFREYCNSSSDPLDVEKLSAVMGEVLNDDHKALIIRYLGDISAADGDISEEETALLQKVKNGLALQVEKSGGDRR